jgi:hypothetical protein
MPHLILSGAMDLERVTSNLGGEIHRWGPAVLKTEASWRRADGLAVLVEGVVVEHSRPLHPVAVISLNHGDTSVRLWQLAPVERTPAVQRWLASIAGELRRLGSGPLKTTNISDELWQDLGLCADSATAD